MKTYKEILKEINDAISAEIIATSSDASYPKKYSKTLQNFKDLLDAIGDKVDGKKGFEFLDDLKKRIDKFVESEKGTDTPTYYANTFLQNLFTEKLSWKYISKMKGKKTRVPQKKCPVKVDFRKML